MLKKFVIAENFYYFEADMTADTQHSLINFIESHRKAEMISPEVDVKRTWQEINFQTLAEIISKWKEISIATAVTSGNDLMEDVLKVFDFVIMKQKREDVFVVKGCTLNKREPSCANRKWMN